MKNKILFAILAAIVILIPQPTFAQEKASRSSANIKLSDSKIEGFDNRVKIVKRYLIKHDSPMVGDAEYFVKYADEYNLDWRFVLAISGVESSYGKRIPPASYNGWGWGVYGDNVIRFNSWEDGIQTVSQGLREKYMDKWGRESISEIGSIYASSPHWTNSVNIHLGMIQRFILSNPQNTLSLSL